MHKGREKNHCSRYGIESAYSFKRRYFKTMWGPKAITRLPNPNPYPNPNPNPYPNPKPNPYPNPNPNPNPNPYPYPYPYSYPYLKRNANPS